MSTPRAFSPEMNVNGKIEGPAESPYMKLVSCDSEEVMGGFRVAS